MKRRGSREVRLEFMLVFDWKMFERADVLCRMEGEEIGLRGKQELRDCGGCESVLFKRGLR